jgi:hypothetical protein
MGRFLGKYADKGRFTMICLVTAGLIHASLSFVSIAYAAHYNATVTGYAFGLYGAAGVRLEQWHFANHPPGTMCGGQRDSSGDWPWGTRIQMDNPVMQHDAINNAYYESDFYLYDNTTESPVANSPSKGMTLSTSCPCLFSPVFQPRSASLAGCQRILGVGSPQFIGAVLSCYLGHPKMR